MFYQAVTIDSDWPQFGCFRTDIGESGVERRLKATIELEQVRQIHKQQPRDKNKLYAPLHAPDEVECIGK